MICKETSDMKHPDTDECEKILEGYGTPEHVRKHCRAVSSTAVAVGEALNGCGHCLDLDLIRAAGMLHDIARTEDRHWEVGADIIRKLGYEEEADIIEVHMTYSPFSDISEASETDMVCLADRVVKEDSFVGIDERVEYLIEKSRRRGHPEAEKILLEKKKETEAFILQIEEAAGMSLADIVGRGEKKESGRSQI